MSARRGPMPVQKMTREEFERWIHSQRGLIQVEGPFVIEACTCRDLNCRGWRLAPRAEAIAR